MTILLASRKIDAIPHCPRQAIFFLLAIGHDFPHSTDLGMCNPSPGVSLSPIVTSFVGAQKIGVPQFPNPSHFRHGALTHHIPISPSFFQQFVVVMYGVVSFGDAMMWVCLVGQGWSCVYETNLFSLAPLPSFR